MPYSSGPPMQEDLFLLSRIDSDSDKHNNSAKWMASACDILFNDVHRHMTYIVIRVRPIRCRPVSLKSNCPCHSSDGHRPEGPPMHLSLSLIHT